MREVGARRRVYALSLDLCPLSRIAAQADLAPPGTGEDRGTIAIQIRQSCAPDTRDGVLTPDEMTGLLPPQSNGRKIPSRKTTRSG